MDLLNETVLLKTKSTLFNLLIRETSHFLCYERLLNMTYVVNKNAFFREVQFWSHCYTVVSYQALFKLSVYKIPAVYLSGAKNVCFCTIRNFGSPTTRCCMIFLSICKKMDLASRINKILKNLTKRILKICFYVMDNQDNSYFYKRVGNLSYSISKVSP